MIINTELENSAVVVMKDGNKFDVNIVGENLETLQTYLRSGRVALSLLDMDNKDDSVINELILEKQKLFVRLPDGSIRAVSGQADDDLRFLIDNIVEIGTNEIKPSANVKFFFKTSAYDEPKDLREALRSADAKKYVLYVDEKPTSDSSVVRSLVVPFMDIDHIEVPVVDEDGNFTGTFINLTQHINNIYKELITYIEEVKESTKDLAKGKENRQIKNGINLIRPQDISFNRIDNYKDGISVYRLRNDNSGSNGWQNILNTMGIQHGAEAILTIKTSPIRDDEDKVITADATSGGLYLSIEPVDGIRESQGNRYRTVQGCVRRGDNATTIEWIYGTPHLLQDDRFIYGDKFNRGATNITSVRQINRSGFYYLNNTGTGSNDAPTDYAVSGTSSSGRVETQGMVFASVAKPATNSEVAYCSMTFISSTTGYTYHTTKPMQFNITKRNANDLDWDVGSITVNPTWSKMLDASFISDLIKPGDTFRTAQYLSTRNMDDVKELGVFYQDSNANTTGRNYPTNEAGTLVVSRAAGIIQTYYVYGPTGGIYTRGYYGNAWSTWRKYMYESGTYNTLTLTNWIRSSGNTGWYNTTHGGQIYQNSSADIKVSHILNPLAGVNMSNDVEVSWTRNTDFFKIGFMNTGDANESYAYFETGDNNTEYFMWRHRVSGATTPVEWMRLNNSVLKVHNKNVIVDDKTKTYGSLVLSDWIRTTGTTGWRNDTYGGGIHMQDTTWVRISDSKKFYVSATANDAINTAGGVTCKNITIGGTLITVEV